jgi:hypothetical protein
VKSLVRSLLVWLLLLALPFQAFAAASMLPRVGQAAAVPVHAAPAADVPPCHAQMMAAMAQDAPAPGHMAAPATASAHDEHAGRHDKNKCGTCAACCVGAAMAPSLPATLALPAPSTVSIPFHAGHLPSVDPVLLERPPSALRA